MKHSPSNSYDLIREREPWEEPFEGSILIVSIEQSMQGFDLNPWALKMYAEFGAIASTECVSSKQNDSTCVLF